MSARQNAAAIFHPSPNYGPRRGGGRPGLIVIHYTAMRSAEAARDRLCDPAFEVSAHYLIGRDGTLWQLVEDGMRAWHAGAGAWAGRDDINSRSIGIELDNDGAAPFAAPMMDRLEALLHGVMARHGIAPAQVIGHACMAPGRKIDPGPRFDWRRLAQGGLAVWPAPRPDDEAPPHPEGFAQALHAFGYPDSAPDALLQAFRDRFRPGATGPLSGADMAAARALARCFPVDRPRPRA